MRTAPSGRISQEMAKAPRLRRRETLGSVVGKNCLAKHHGEQGVEDEVIPLERGADVGGYGGVEAGGDRGHGGGHGAGVANRMPSLCAVDSGRPSTPVTAQRVVLFWLA